MSKALQQRFMKLRNRKLSQSQQIRTHWDSNSHTYTHSIHNNLAQYCWINLFIPHYSSCHRNTQSCTQRHDNVRLLYQSHCASSHTNTPTRNSTVNYSHPSSCLSSNHINTTSSRRTQHQNLRYFA